MQQSRNTYGVVHWLNEQQSGLDLELDALNNLTDTTPFALIPSARETCQSTFKHSTLTGNLLLRLFES